MSCTYADTRAPKLTIARADKSERQQTYGSQYLSLVAADCLVRAVPLVSVTTSVLYASIMSLPAVSRLFRTALRSRVVPVANLTTKPAKENLSAGEQAIGMTAFFVVVLVPSFWIMAHLEDYKKK
ncbi:cytochrome c oxidase subunit 8B [Poecilia formosa]|nr:PREDICTED: cytochrome c oxidase subunit 8B, mitochondrial [Poecilia formosa]